MKAVVLKQYGGPEELEVRDVENPEPLSNELQIQVAYAAVNPVDWKIREGYLKTLFVADFPAILGWDVSGTISKLGSDVSSFQVGDEVFSYCRKPLVKWGTYAEFVCVEDTHVASKPDKISFAEAAGVPLVALTAWQALYEKIQLQSGEKIFIPAGAGGVGSYAIQFAKEIGAHVYTSASPSNHDYLKSLGADRVIDYHTEDFVSIIREDHPEGIEAIFDCMGGETLDQSFQAAKKGGRLYSIVQKVDPELLEKYELSGGFVLVRPDGPQLAEIASLIKDGKVLVVDTEEMPLEKAAEAQEKNKQGHTRGKIVLKV